MNDVSTRALLEVRGTLGIGLTQMKGASLCALLEVRDKLVIGLT